jgi:hypothetical protein
MIAAAQPGPGASSGTSASVRGTQSAEASTGNATDTPLVIQINGANPAIIFVGDTYTDLGAVVTDSHGHSLSYRTFVNATLENEIIIWWRGGARRAGKSTELGCARSG